MTEKQVAQMFSDQVDSFLEGQPIGNQDPLQSLAAEMIAGPEIDPSPEFAARLRHRFQLSLSDSSRRNVHIRRRWLLAGAAVVLVLTLFLVWNPLTPSAADVLARTADTVAIAPGYIEYKVLWTEIEINSDGTVLSMRYIAEYWGREVVTTDNRLTTAEVAGTIYDEYDVELVYPLSQLYGSPTEICFRDLGASVTDLPNNANSEGCFVYETDLNDPGPFARFYDEGLREWIGRMEDNIERIEFQETSFNDRPVFSLKYHDISVSKATAESTSSQGVESASGTTAIYTETLYIDRETYMPVGLTYEFSDDSSGSMIVTQIVTQTILEYEVLDPKDLDFDPFAWPPD